MKNSTSDSTLPNGHTELSFLIIGAGSRGNAYASALNRLNPEIPNRIWGIAEPISSKRHSFERKYVRQNEPCELFSTWQEFVEYGENQQRTIAGGGGYSEGVDGVFVCTLDEMHAEIITALAPLCLHIMSEKPLATKLNDCLKIYRSLQPPGTVAPRAVFSIGHVLRYSPHNLLLRKLLLEDEVVGDVVSIEHAEPVGWWHFAHSYVR